VLLDEIKSETIPEHHVDLCGGTIALCEVSHQKAIFMVVGIYAEVTPGTVEQRIKEVFNGECEVLEYQISWKHSVVFSRPLNETLRDPRSFLLSTQRKFVEIVEEFRRDAVEKSIMFDQD
jgi:hypothetical protein